MARERKDEALQTVTAPGKIDRLKEHIDRSLPYHAQWIPAGTQFDAELAAPIEIACRLRNTSISRRSDRAFRSTTR